MEARQALLIGIPGCDNPELFEAMPDVVRADITRMARALAESGYDITVLGAEPDHPVGHYTHVPGAATRSRCLDEIQAACERVPEGGTLVIYFSGHGVRLGDTDYLVPQDVSRAGPNGVPRPDRLIRVGFAEEAAGCAARTVVCFLDACRDERMTVPGPSSGQQLPELAAGSFVLVRGCAPGEVCRYDQVKGSIFTRALARALRRDESPRTLDQVLRAVEDWMKEHEEPQVPHRVFAGAISEAAVLGTAICDGVDLFADWRLSVSAAKLWSLVEDRAAVDALRPAVEDLVAGYGKVLVEQRDRLSAGEGLTDPWTDDRHPGRVLYHLHLLLTRPDGAAARLTAAEAAILVSAPFLREAVLALGLFDVVGVRPREFDRKFEPGYRSDLENVFANHEQLVRRAAGLADSAPRDCDSLAMWLLHRWILEREDLWERRTVEFWTTELARAVQGPADIPGTERRISELGPQLLAVVRCVTTSLGPALRAPAFEPIAKNIRPKALGFLLSLAGVLAVDPRRMSGYVADHVGTHDAVRLDQLHDVLATEVTWQRDDADLVLDAICDHPAVHAVLADVVAEADSACATYARKRHKLPAEDRDLLAGLPGRCRENLRPDRSAYEKPLLRFHLADDRIRDLLMGTQLYRDPTVALRELYQNALDACRYRHMRLRCEHRSDEPAGWAGEIVFRQGVDDRGRPYIECQDNGVGMTEAVLRYAFTEAGTRFVHTQEFRREEARWRRADPAYRLYPNSQFGIGVFSYFMLADEVLMSTVATDERGVASDSPLHIWIPSHGGLFRLRKDKPVPDGIKGGGTVVRLYLSSGIEASCAKTLAQHLVVAEYDVTVLHNGEPAAHWAPHEPADVDKLWTVPPQPAAAGVWWVPAGGLRLSDGLRVGGSFEVEHRGGRYGRVVNLTGPQQPRLSVDRTSMLEWDRAWTEAQERRSIPALREWAGLTWPWVWTMAQEDNPLAQDIFERLGDVAAPVRLEAGTARARLDRVGCLPQDADVVARIAGPEGLPSMRVECQFGPAAPWRRAVWRPILAAAGLERVDPFGAEPITVAGFPVPTPADFRALRSVVNFWEAVARRRTVDRRAAIGDQSAADLLYHLRRFVLTGLDLRPARHVGPHDDPHVLAAVLSEPTGNTPPPRVLILRLANLVGWELTDTVERCRGAAILWGITLPEPAPGGHSVPTQRDIELASRDFDGVAPWRVGMSNRAIRHAAKRAGLSPQEVFDRFAALAPAGFQPPTGPWDPAAVGEGDDRRLVDFLDDLETPPTPRAIVGLAHQMEMSQSEILSRLRDLATEVGLALEIGDDLVAPDRVPTREDIALVDRLTSDRSRERPSLLPAGPLAELIRYRQFHLPEAPTATVVELYRRNEHLLRVPRMVTGAHLVQTAVALKASVGHAAAAVGELFAGWLALDEVADPAPDAAVLRPSLHDCRALLDYVGGAARWRPLTARSIAAYAVGAGLSVGAALAELAPYGGLGARVPSVDGELAAYRPDEYDVHALELAAGLGDVTALGPLPLIRVAGRFGWTVRQAHARLSRFADLGVVATVPAADCPDEIVDWADPIVLSEYFDGAEPALSGEVSGARLAAAAEAVREPVARTRARLERYAAVFRLEIEGLSDHDA